MFSTLLSISTLLVLGVSSVPVARDTSPISIPIKGLVDTKGFRTIADADRARAAVLRSQALAKHTKRGNVPVLNTAVTYTADVQVGSPPVDYTLLVDTGSSNTWVGAGKAYTATSTSHETGDTVSVSYGSGSFSGKEYTDQVTLSPELVIKKQSIGVASESTGFGDGIDGILGVGPVDLTAGTLSPSGSLIPTVTDNLHTQGTISSNVLGVYYEPATSLTGALSGELTFGGVDQSKIVGDLNYVPVTNTNPASDYWGIDQAISYNGNTVLANTPGIVDTGTTLVLIASDAFKKYQKATGAVPDETTGLLKITSKQLGSLKSLFFNIGNKRYELTANAQIWPRALNTQIGGDAQSIYLIVADLGSNSGGGLDFINGYGFLERYYSVYDTSKMQVGFAATAHTFATSN